ncbi:MAG: glycosyltransferase family 4 protein [Myxococcota bacterium]
MRPGFLVPFLDPRPAGVGIYIEEIGRRLCARLPGTIVYTPRPERLPSWLAPEQLRVIPSGRPSLGLAGAQRRLARLAWLAGPARLAFARDGVDVFLSPVAEGPLFPGVPSVLVVHDLTALRYPEGYQRATVLQTRWGLPLMARHAAALVAVSENTRRDLVRELGLPAAKITVVGEGYDAATFFPRGAEAIAAVRAKFALTQPYLFYAGTLSRHKNLALVLEALAALTPEFPTLEFVHAGRRDVGIGGELERAAARLGVSARYRSLDYVSRDELATLMSGCAAFVYPSRYEGFGLAPLEAMACGAPVVASRVASLPEVVGAGGALVDEGEPWAGPMGRVLRGPRGEWTARARAQASRFDWDRAVDGLIECMQQAREVVRDAS